MLWREYWEFISGGEIVKKWIWIFTVILLCAGMVACFPAELSATTGTSEAGKGTSVSTSTTVSRVPTTSSAPNSTTLPPATTVPSAGLHAGPVGWVQEGEKWYFYHSEGERTVGFAQIDDGMYYFDEDGTMHTGWLTLEDERYYLGSDGHMQIGWIQVEGNQYYMDLDGTMHVGWLILQDNLYYLQKDGVMARGMVEINGRKTYFTASGAYIMLLNPWHTIKEDLVAKLITVEKYVYGTQQVEELCYDALMNMLEDCNQQCGEPMVVSSYRTVAYQQILFENKVQRLQKLGHDRAEAERLAAMEVAIPGTSEHHTGLAVDIVDASWPHLETEQENLPVQKWLMENCWKYGFILRYPADKTASTGIIYEPWHYRYVGKELAKVLHESAMTLEEYLDRLTREVNT